MQSKKYFLAVNLFDFRQKNIAIEIYKINHDNKNVGMKELHSSSNIKFFI